MGVGGREEPCHDGIHETRLFPPLNPPGIFITFYLVDCKTGGAGFGV